MLTRACRFAVREENGSIRSLLFVKQIYLGKKKIVLVYGYCLMMLDRLSELEIPKTRSSAFQKNAQ